MKKTVRGFILGFITAWLLSMPLLAFADTIQVALNTVNINLNGAQVVTKGESYVHINGTVLPYSLNYNGTVYLPIRKVSEIMGKDIGYDGKSSTVSISDKNPGTAPSAPAAEVPNNSSNNAPEDEDTAKDDSDDNKIETGFGVINGLTDVKSHNKWVDRAKGFMDGDSFNMLTSKSDLIELAETIPAVYEITYSDDIITDIEMLSIDKEDMLKANPEGNKLVCYKDTYNLSSNAIIYRMERDADGNFNGYAVSEMASLSANDKVYLFEIGGKRGYDIVIEENSWI